VRRIAAHPAPGNNGGAERAFRAGSASRPASAIDGRPIVGSSRSSELRANRDHGKENSVVLLQLDAVCRSFGGLKAINEVTMHVDEGEVVGLVGQNGAGKSTLVNLISGGLRPTSGQILLNGTALHRMPTHAVARLGVARTFQLTRSFSEFSTRENVMMGALFGSNRVHVDAARDRATSLIDDLGLSDLADEPITSLTLAVRKRVEIARALAADPILLLLDEVAAGLTPTETDDLIDRLRRCLPEHTAVIVIEHVLDVILQLARRAYVLDQGEVIAEGAPAELFARQDVIARYIGAPQ
jgi:branched-chain amino acid transport system ATP-binding protein